MSLLKQAKNLMFLSIVDAVDWLMENHAIPIEITDENIDLLLKNVCVNTTKAGKIFFTIKNAPLTIPILSAVSGTRQ